MYERISAMIHSQQEYSKSKKQQANKENTGMAGTHKKQSFMTPLSIQHLAPTATTNLVLIEAKARSFSN